MERGLNLKKRMAARPGPHCVRGEGKPRDHVRDQRDQRDQRDHVRDRRDHARDQRNHVRDQRDRVRDQRKRVKHAARYATSYAIDAVNATTKSSCHPVSGGQKLMSCRRDRVRDYAITYAITYVI